MRGEKREFQPKDSIILKDAMAHVSNSVVNPNDLSSNWKKLQVTLSPNTSKIPKRRAADDVLQPQQKGVKRQKIRHTKRFLSQTVRESTNGNDMGISWSKADKDAPSSSLALWAHDNDIPAKDLAAAYGTSLKTTSIPDIQDAKERVNEGLAPLAEAGKFVAIDCEMVGVGPTPDHESALARVSLVNYHGHQLYDSFVLPKETITDYRTHVSGITPLLLQEARPLETVQAELGPLLEGRILVGHAIRNDLGALLLGHPKRDIRDTSKHPPFRALASGKTPGLKRLARETLKVDIQGGEHSSLEDARATMLLFRMEKHNFEMEHLKIWGPDYNKSVKAQNTDVEKAGGEKKKRRKKKKAKKR